MTIGITATAFLDFSNFLISSWALDMFCPKVSFASLVLFNSSKSDLLLLVSWSNYVSTQWEGKIPDCMTLEGDFETLRFSSANFQFLALVW